MPTPVSRATFAAACLLFCISGAAGLIYELLWVRVLTALLGTGVYAISAVLAAFMGGLALGAAAAARFADRIRGPFVAYSILELLIAGAGLVLPLIWDEFAAFDARLYAHWGNRPEMLAVFRFLAVTLVLLPPTTLMGATLPVLARAVVNEPSHLAGRVGLLYAFNTLGTVGGVVLTGFFLLDHFGIALSGRIAVWMNLTAGSGAIGLWLLDRRRRSETDCSAAPQPAVAESAALARNASHRETAGDRQARSMTRPDATFRLISLCMFFTGLTALAAEVLWSRSLTFLFDDRLRNTTYCFSAVLTIYLAGIAVGSAAVGPLVHRLRQPMYFYGLALTVMAVSLAFSAQVLHSTGLRNWMGWGGTSHAKLPGAVATMMIKTAAVLGLPTLLMGVAFPVAIRIAVRENDVGRQTGRLYFLNTLGSVCGSLAAAFVIIPTAGLTGGLRLLAAVDGAIALACIWSSSGGKQRFLVPGALLAGAALAPGLMHVRDGRFATLHPGESLLHYDEGAVATVSVVEDSRGHRRICVDDVPVAGTSLKMQTDQKSLAHLPMLLVPEPRAALTVGFGSGGTSYSFLLYDCLEKVHCVEICPGVVRAAGALTASNHGFLERPDERYRVIFDDARAYLRGTGQQYDIISTDCTDLRYKSSANLYDVEYFEHCRNRLRPGGLVVVWMPLGGLSDEMFRTTLRTFLRVFPEMAVFYMHNDWTHYVLLVGGHERLQIDFARAVRRIAQPRVLADLQDIGLQNPYKLLATFTASGPALAAYLRGDLVNTQDRPVLEFEAPRYMAGHHETIQSNLDSLMRFHTSIESWLVPNGITDEQRLKLSRYVEAVPYIVAAQRAEVQMNVEEATLAYREAIRLCPDDADLHRALEFPQIVELAEQGNPTAWLLLGRSQQLQEHFSRALTYFNRYFDALQNSSDSRFARDLDMTLRDAVQRQALAWRATAERWRSECRREMGQEPGE